jgi:hypothetical protein
VTEDEYYREKIQLDKQRLELDKNKSKFEASVFHRHAGAVITASELVNENGTPFVLNYSRIRKS